MRRSPGRRPDSSPRSRFVGRAGLLGAVVLAALVTTPLSMAFLSAEDTLPGFEITTGSAGLTLSGAADEPMPVLYPGSVQWFGMSETSPLMVSNTGDVPLDLHFGVAPSASGSDADRELANSLIVTAWLTTSCPSEAGDAPTYVGSLAGGMTSETAVIGTLQPGEDARLCTLISVPLDVSAASQDATLPALVLTITGEQVGP